jgi:hypothetical protein
MSHRQHRFAIGLSEMTHSRILVVLLLLLCCAWCDGYRACTMGFCDPPRPDCNTCTDYPEILPHSWELPPARLQSFGLWQAVRWNWVNGLWTANTTEDHPWERDGRLIATRAFVKDEVRKAQKQTELYCDKLAARCKK